MMLVVDANVAVRWSIRMALSDQAMRLLRDPVDLIAPDLIIAEVANVFFKDSLQNPAYRQRALEGLDLMPRWFHTLVPASDLRMRALTLAFELNHPAYDCFYLALAEQADTTLITTDERLIRIAAYHAISKRIVHLSDYNT